MRNSGSLKAQEFPRATLDGDSGRRQRDRDVDESSPRVAIQGSRRAEKIAVTVARDIVRDIKGLLPGTRLPPEPELAERYGVARSTVREALRILELQGLLTIKVGPGGGPTVMEIDSRNFARMASLYFHFVDGTYRDIVQARMALEPMMARLAALRTDRDAVGALNAFVDSSIDPKSPSYLENATGFHATLSGMSGNPVLDVMGRSLQHIYVDRLEGTIFPVDARPEVQEQHAAIAKAVMRGHADRAERLMRAHMVEFAAVAAENNPGVLDEAVRWI